MDAHHSRNDTGFDETPPSSPFKLWTRRRIVREIATELVRETVIAVAAAITLLGAIGALTGEVFSNAGHHTDGWLTVRWLFAAVGGFVYAIEAWLLADVVWKAVRQRTPFRLMYEAVVEYQLAKNDPGFSQLSRHEIEVRVAIRRHLPNL